MTGNCFARGLVLSKHTPRICFGYYLLFIVCWNDSAVFSLKHISGLGPRGSGRNRTGYPPREANSEDLCPLGKEEFVSRRKRRGEWEGRNNGVHANSWAWWYSWGGWTMPGRALSILSDSEPSLCPPGNPGLGGN